MTRFDPDADSCNSRPFMEYIYTYIHIQSLHDKQPDDEVWQDNGHTITSRYGRDAWSRFGDRETHYTRIVQWAYIMEKYRYEAGMDMHGYATCRRNYHLTGQAFSAAHPLNYSVIIFQLAGLSSLSDHFCFELYFPRTLDLCCHNSIVNRVNLAQY